MPSRPLARHRTEAARKVTALAGVIIVDALLAIDFAALALIGQPVRACADQPELAQQRPHTQPLNQDRENDHAKGHRHQKIAVRKVFR